MGWSRSLSDASETVRKPGTDLDLDAGEADRLVSPLQAERDAVVARPPEDVLDRKTASDLALAGFVRRAVGRGFRMRVVAPVPFDGGAVVLLEVVRAADDLGDELDFGRRDADDRIRFQPNLRPLRVLRFLTVLARIFLSAGCVERRERDTRRADDHRSP